MFRLFAALLLAWSAIPSARAETFDNAAVIALTRAGLGSEVIVAKIAALPCGYDLSTAGLLALRGAGVGQEVVVAMLHKCTGASRAQGLDNTAADPAARHAPGIYLAGSDANAPLTLLRPAASVGLKYTGNGSILFPHKATLTLGRAAAQIATRLPRPTFFFYFDPADEKTNTFGTLLSAAVQSPGEFTLVQFRTDRDTRRLAIGRTGPFAEVSGLDPRIALPFAITEIGDGAFRVEVGRDLPTGQYGFVLVGEGPRGRTYYRIFDFAID